MNLDNEFLSDVFEETATKKKYGKGTGCTPFFFQLSLNRPRKFKLHTFRLTPSVVLDTLHIRCLVKLEALLDLVEDALENYPNDMTADTISHCRCCWYFLFKTNKEKYVF